MYVTYCGSILGNIHLAFSLEKIPTAFALKELTAAEKARIIVLIKKAVG